LTSKSGNTAALIKLRNMWCFKVAARIKEKVFAINVIKFEKYIKTGGGHCFRIQWADINK
jgi:hypothetical protein